MKDMYSWITNHPVVEKYVKFLFVGGSGVLLNLLVTWVLTTFFFGLQNYFYAYLIGTGVNLVYNFILYSQSVFKTSSKHVQRFSVFVMYSVGMTMLQVFLVREIVEFLGEEFYLFVIASVIFVLSIISFLVFNLSIFKKNVKK